MSLLVITVVMRWQHVTFYVQTGNSAFLWQYYQNLNKSVAVRWYSGHMVKVALRKFLYYELYQDMSAFYKLKSCHYGNYNMAPLVSTLCRQSAL